MAALQRRRHRRHSTDAGATLSPLPRPLREGTTRSGTTAPAARCSCSSSPRVDGGVLRADFTLVNGVSVLVDVARVIGGVLFCGARPCVGIVGGGGVAASGLPALPLVGVLQVLVVVGVLPACPDPRGCRRMAVWRDALLRRCACRVPCLTALRPAARRSARPCALRSRTMCSD